ncbi:tetratricopeptide repeat protein [Acinetobacter sp. HZNU-JH01]|uniref:tetratricopeptide repeat protein n=1 Tax=Acinetobacter sp. HZNU-JH01 TaxID=3136280 RepID=UPI0030F44BF5
MKSILYSLISCFFMVGTTYACEKIEYSDQIKKDNFDINISNIQGDFKRVDDLIYKLPDGFYKEYVLGVSFLDGKRKLIDLKKAENHLKKSARYCFSPAHYSLGYLYYIAGALEDSKKWLLSAQNLGDSLAAYQLGLIYKKENNPEKMLESLEFSARNDFTPSITELGVQFYDGDLVRRDFIKAFKYFEKAASKNDSLAQNNLGWMYEKGEGGINKNKERALYWYKTAYDNGFLGAAENYNRLLIEK